MLLLQLAALALVGTLRCRPPVAAAEHGRAGIVAPCGCARGLARFPLQHLRHGKTRVVAAAASEVEEVGAAAVPASGPVAESWAVSELTEADVACLSTRQVFHSPDRIRGLIIGVGRRCRYGWPQAVFCDPLRNNTFLGNLVFLTCPLLAGEIDIFELNGTVARYDERARTDPAWQAQVAETHAAHVAMKAQLLEGREEELEALTRRLGDKNAGAIQRKGLDLDPERKKPMALRCLHAQVADEFVRGGNIIAQEVLRDLEEQGVPIDGHDDCCAHCDMKVPMDEVAWKYNSHKWSMRMRLRKQRQREATRPSRPSGTLSEAS